MCFKPCVRLARRYGVGGEYPMAAGSAAERAETGGIAKARHRGREVVLTFSMQARPPLTGPVLKSHACAARVADGIASSSRGLLIKLGTSVGRSVLAGRDGIK